MTPAATVAVGLEAVAGLKRQMESRQADDWGWRTHREHAVAWCLRHPWVSYFDDGDVLVVVDGQLHDSEAACRSPAEAAYLRYRQLGSGLARDLLGDFVVIVLDRIRETLLVSRDSLGVRPWYQAGDGRRGAGASDVATLHAMPWVDRELNERQAMIYLAGIFESHGETLYNGISSLPAGHTWTSSRIGTQQWAHHQWNVSPEPEVDLRDAVDRCRTVLDEVVRDRQRAAGAATSELSGGLDSSAVVGTLAQLGVDDLLVGRLRFDDPRAEEHLYFDSVIQHWNLRALSARPWILSYEEASEWTSRLRRPIPGSNFTMQSALHRAFQAEGRTTCMTGIGGDDAFVALSRSGLVLNAIRNRRGKLLVSVLREDVRHPRSAWRTTWRSVLGHYVPHRRRALVPSHINDSAARNAGLAAFSRQGRAQLTGDSAVDERAEGLTSGYVASIMEEAALVSDMTGWRSTHPMLDPRFVQATYGLDPWFAVMAGHDRGLEVAAFGDRLPDAVRTRRTKAEFSSTVWEGREASDVLRKRLLSGPIIERGWMDIDSMADLLARVQRRDPGVAHYFDRVASMDRWLRWMSG